MKKAIIILCSLAGVFIVLIIVIRITGILSTYKTPTGSMEPALMQGSTVIVSSLKKPARNAIIVFERDALPIDYAFNPDKKRFNYMYRLIGMGGDKLEIKNGVAYINGKAEDSIRLKFPYKFGIRDAMAIKDQLQIDDTKDYGDWMPLGDSVIIYAALRDLNGITSIAVPARKREVYDEKMATELFMNDTIKKWTASDYGPVTIPAGHYFVMGDNRYKAMDSRYVGFVPEKAYKGSVLTE